MASFKTLNENKNKAFDSYIFHQLCVLYHFSSVIAQQKKRIHEQSLEAVRSVVMGEVLNLSFANVCYQVK